jgi:hypothetical protein
MGGPNCVLPEQTLNFMVQLFGGLESEVNNAAPIWPGAAYRNGLFLKTLLIWR